MEKKLPLYIQDKNVIILVHNMYNYYILNILLLSLSFSSPAIR